VAEFAALAPFNLYQIKTFPEPAVDLLSCAEN